MGSDSPKWVLASCVMEGARCSAHRTFGLSWRVNILLDAKARMPTAITSHGFIPLRKKDATLFWTRLRRIIILGESGGGRPAPSQSRWFLRRLWFCIPVRLAIYSHEFMAPILHLLDDFAGGALTLWTRSVRPLNPFLNREDLIWKRKNLTLTCQWARRRSWYEVYWSSYWFHRLCIGWWFIWV